MEISREKKEVEAVAKMQKRVSTAAAKTTSMSDLLKNRDVINVMCGEDEAELLRVRKMLREEKQLHSQTRCAKDQLEENLSAARDLSEAQRSKIVCLQTKIAQLEKEKQQVIVMHTHTHTYPFTHLLYVQAVDEALQQYQRDKEAEQRRHREDLRRLGGLSGQLLTSDEHHQGAKLNCTHIPRFTSACLTTTEHPSDAQRYFGFPSWQETKKYIECIWPGMEMHTSSSQNSIRTSFEQCLMAKMFMKTAFEHEDLARI